MKIELKSVKVYRGMSEETLAFTADVWIDGRKSFYAKNDGHGGETYLQPYARDASGLRERVEAWVTANVPDDIIPTGATSRLCTECGEGVHEDDSPGVWLHDSGHDADADHVALLGEGEATFTLKHTVESYVDKLVEDADQARADKREKTRIAKEDAKQLLYFAAKGIKRVLRWRQSTTRAIEHRWFGIPDGKTPEEIVEIATARYKHKEASLKPEITWEVVS